MMVQINILILDMILDLVLVPLFLVSNFNQSKNFIIFGVYWSIFIIIGVYGVFFFLLFFIFINKNRNIKKKLAANLETIAIHTSSFVGHTELEDFHKVSRAQRDIFHKSVHATKDYTCKNLKNIIENKYLVLISSGKGSCVVILKRSDYDEKFQSIIKDGTYILMEHIPQLQTQH